MSAPADARAQPATLLSLSPSRAVWAVAWPMATLGLCLSAYNLTDTLWVGRLGPAPLAALGGSAFAFWAITLACGLAGTGTHALVARHEGAAIALGTDRRRIDETLSQGLFVGLGVALLLAALSPTSGFYFDLLGFGHRSPEHRYGVQYIGSAMLGASTLAVYAVVQAAFRGIGRTRPILVLTLVTVVLNAGLDPLLIWGLGPVPALGVAGAAWATVIANGVGAIVGLRVLSRLGIRPTLGLPRLRDARLIARIGLPTTAAGIGFSLVYVALGRFITGFGAEQMGALGVGHRLEGLAYLVCTGLEVGTATMVGQHLGAGRVEDARRTVRAAARLCSTAMIPFTVFLYVAAAPLMSIFTNDAATIAAGALYLRVQAVVIIFMGLETVFRGAFTGAGDTVPSFWIEASWTAFRIPLAWALAFPFGLGIEGVWVAIAATTVVKAVHLWIWFRRDRWATALGGALS